MSHIEAMKQALRKAFNLGSTYWQQADSDYQSQWKKADVTQASFNELVETTLTTLRTAIEAAEKQEPRPISDFPELQEAVRKGLADGSLTIQGAAPVQEPVCAMCKSTHGKWSWMCGRCLLIHDKQPPAAQRQWVGLTLADKEEFLAQDFGGSRLDAMDWAARKLKEKNHG